MGVDRLGELNMPLLHLGGWCINPETAVQALHLFVITTKLQKVTEEGEGLVLALGS